MSFLLGLLGNLGGLLGGLGNIGGIAGGLTGIANLFSGVPTAMAQAFRKIGDVIKTSIKKLGDIVQTLLKRLPLAGLAGVFAFVVLCNAGIVPCNKPSPADFPVVYATSFTPPPPPKPAVPLEYARPNLVSVTQLAATAGARPMSMQPTALPGFSITIACPWLMKVPVAAPTIQMTYAPKQVYMAFRTPTQQ